jgi:hypothetical protein
MRLFRSSGAFKENSQHEVGKPGQQGRSPRSTWPSKHLVALHVTPADEHEWAQSDALAKAVRDVAGESVEPTYIDQDYTGDDAFDVAANHGIIREVVNLEEARRGLVLLPRDWVVEHSLGLAARFRGLAKDYDRLSEIFVARHFMAFSLLILQKAASVFKWSS